MIHLFRKQGSTVCSDTNIWFLDRGPQLGNFQFSCTEPDYCPFGIAEGGPEKCCPNANFVVCCNGDCVSGGDCAPCETTSASLTPTPDPTPDPTPEPPPSSVAPPPSSDAPLPSETPANECNCNVGWYCSTNGYTQCCEEEGMAFCPDAEACYRESDGQSCCGNTLCWSGQTCAPGGNSCIITTTLATLASSSEPPTSYSPASETPTPLPSSSLSTQATSSSPDETTASRLATATPSPVDAEGTTSEAIIPTTASNAGESSVLDVLQTAVPQSVQSDLAGACFLNTAYTTYTTPYWYTVMPSNAQSYFSSVNAENTAACIAPYGGGSGLSPGAKAGIGVGVAVGLAGLGGLVYLLIKLGIIGSSSAAAGGSSAAAVSGASSAAPPPPPTWNGITGPEWSGVTGSGAAPPAPNNVPIPPIIAAAAIRRSSDNDNRTELTATPYPRAQRINSNLSASPSHSPFGSGSYPQYNNAYYPPPRSVSPPDMNPSEMDNVSPHPELSGAQSQVSEAAGTSLSGELWAGGAVQGGYEISGNERFEAPGSNWKQYPDAQNHSPRY